MGGLLAQQLAARIQPFALVLLTPAWPRGVFGVRPSNFIAFFRAVMRWGFWRKPQKPSFARAVTSAFNASVPPEKHRPLYAQLVEESGRVIVEIAFWMFDRARASAVDPAAVRCPVYVVSCGEDRLTPTGPVRSTAALYPQASLRHYPDRGHWVLDDIETDEMTAEIANWLKGHEQRAAARARG
jgi:pimeloyl-ACP methyl ester carboxylesterase